VVVAFEFTGGAGAVAFQAGPGDPNGDPTFAATTDNGTVSSSGFASGGTLEVTLTPDTAGPATVTVTGPCGLDDTLGGNSVTLDVAAAPVGPTPTPAQLPETGGTPASGADVPWLALLVAGAALAGAGGALAALSISHVDPQMAYWTTSGGFVFVTILAGAASVPAAFLGALLFEIVRTIAVALLPGGWQMILGTVLLLTILFVPEGLGSLVIRKRAAVSDKGAA
jgi:hypothetical protein